MVCENYRSTLDIRDRLFGNDVEDGIRFTNENNAHLQYPMLPEGGRVLEMIPADPEDPDVRDWGLLLGVTRMH